MLAYITPEEGGILQLLGGSGAPGPMGIPSFFDTGEGMGSEMGTEQSEDSGSNNDNSTNMGLEDSYYGQTAITNPPTQSESNTNANIAAAIATSRAQDPNYGRFTETIDPAAQTASMLGITPTNPFGYKSPFADFADRFGISLDYSNIFSAPDMNEIANLNIANYNNPNNDPNVAGFDKNQPPNQPRSGIQKGFGSLFGRPTGQMTALGPIAAQRSGKPMDAIALSGFNALAGLSLPGIISNIVGPAQSYAVKGSIGYDPTKDPALAGNKGLGTLADVISMNLTGNTTAGLQDAYTGISSIASDMLSDVKNVSSAVEDAVSFGFNPKGGSVGSVVNDKGYTSSISNYNPNMNDNEGGENRIERPRPTGDPSPIERAPVVGEDFIDPELLKYIKRRPAAPVSEVGYNQDLTASSSSKPIDFSSFDRGLGSLQSGITAINRNR